MPSRSQRKTIRPATAPKLRLQYLIYPYIDLRVGPLGALDHFTIGDFEVWKDISDNWLKYLKCGRPGRHLAMYVDREDNPVQTIWIATAKAGRPVAPELWQRLTASLFYLTWARISFTTIGRPATEDFYSEPFALPEDAEEDSPIHVRYSKAGATLWTQVKVHPALEASLHRCVIELPIAGRSPIGPFYDPTAANLFLKLQKEMGEKDSRIMIGLWFFHQACYLSVTRSGYAEDIQNLCSAFEAILDVSKKGDSSKQVADRLKALFRDLAPTYVEAALSKPPSKERPAVLRQLDLWVKALYTVRNGNLLAPCRNVTLDKTLPVTS